MQNIERFKEFLTHYKKIRSYLGLNSNLDNQFKVFNYTKYLGDNDNITKELVDILTSTNQKVLFVAPTGAGKTFSFMNIFNLVKQKNKEKEIIDDYLLKEVDGEVEVWESFQEVERQAINILFTPKRIQNIQNQNKYDNVKSITMKVSITPEDISNYKNFSVVYDKSSEIISTLETLVGINDFSKMYYFNVVVDECHLLTSATSYRKDGLKRLQDLLELVVREGGNVIYTTGTYDNCYMLDFEKAIVCNGIESSNVNRVEEIICQTGMDSKDFVTSMVANELKKNNKVLLRINSKGIIDNLKTHIEKQGYKVAILTAEEKETSTLYKKIIEESALDNAYDLYIFTCILDEGVTIDTMNGNSTITNIIPMFFLDREASLLDYKQFAARIRWNIEKTILLVDKHESKLEEIVSLQDVVKYESEDYVRFYNSFVKLLEGFNLLYKDETKVKESIEKILNEEDFFGKVNHMHLFTYEDNKIRFDYFDCFNRIFNKYMYQFLNYDVERRHYLQELFSVEVVSRYAKDSELTQTYTDYTSIKFDEFLEELATKEDKQEEFLEGKVDRVVKRDKRFTQLKDLMKYTNINESVAIVKSNVTKEITHIIREYEKEEFLKLDSDDVKKIDIYISKENGDILTTAAKRVVDSSYFDLVKKASNLGINLDKFKEVCKSRTYSQTLDYLKEEQVIQNNKNIRSNHIAGRSCMDQNVFVIIINNYKNGKQQVTLRENDLIEIKTLMCKATGNSWTKQSIKKYLLMVYNVNIEDKKYVVKDLKYKHTL